MPGILAITDGTIRVELKDGPIFIDNWTPAVPGPKNGGIWRNSPLADGRQMAFRRFEHVTDSFQLNISTDAMDDTILATRNLRTLLEKAISYWTAEWQNEPVWIEVRGSCETENRYSLIYDYRTPNDDDPYKDPFHNVPAAIESFTLLLEHGPWLALPPGQGECVEISAQSASQYPYHLEFAGGGATDNVNCLSAAALDNIPSATDFTAEAWVRADGYGGGGLGRIMDKSTGAAGWSMWMSAANGLSAIIYAPTPALSVSGNDEFTADGLWHHVAMTYDDGGARIIRLWIDGNEVTSYSTQTAAIGAYAADAAFDFKIGNNSANTTCWDGGIGWCRLVHAAIYAVNFTPPPRCIIPDISDVIGLWISEGTGATTYNKVGTAGTDGAITGALWDGDCGSLFGREGVCAAVGATDTPFVSNQRGGQLSHVFHFDASIGAYSGNLLAAALPYFLFPQPFAVGDMLYFGSDTTTLDGGPFCSLVFDISAAANAITTDTWEYWNGAWVGGLAMTSSRSDYVFGSTGINVIGLIPPVDWVTTTVYGCNGYLVRCRITGIGAPSTGGRQQLRNVYTVNTPYVETDSAAVLGDIPALGASFQKTVTNNITTRMFLGLRGVDRGSDFTAYINLADRCNPVGLTISVTAPAVFATSPQAPAGRYVNYVPAGVDPMDVCVTVRFTSDTLLQSYYGKYRLLIRYVQTGGATNDFQIMYGVSSSGNVYYGKIITVPSIGIFTQLAILDLGYIDIHSNEVQGYDTTVTQSIQLLLACLSGAPGTLQLFDMILLPVDELGLDCNGDIGSTISYHFADSIIAPKYLYNSGLINPPPVGTMVSRMRYVGSSPLQFAVNSRQRIWYLTGENSYLKSVCASHLRKVERFLSMRGNQ